MPEPSNQRQATGLPQILRRVGVIAALMLSAGSLLAADPVAETQTALRLAIAQAATTGQAPLYPRADFLRRPTIADVQLSPDGRFLSYRQRGAQQTDLMLQDIANGKSRRVLADIRALEMAWSGDGQRLWLADDDGLAVFETGTGEIGTGETGTGSVKRILNWDEKRRQRFWGVDPHTPGHALIREKIDDHGHWQHRVLLIDAAGKTKLLHEAKQLLRGVLLNPDGSIAYSSAYDGARYDTAVRRHTADGVAELMRCPGPEQCNLLSYTRDPDQLWLLSHHGEDKLALQHWKAGRWQTMHRDPMVMADAASLLWQPGGEDWLAIAYHPDRRHWYGRDKTVSAQLAALQAQLKDTSLELATTHNGKRWLVRARHARWDQNRYYLYAPAERRLQPLFSTEQGATPSFAPEHLAGAIPLHYRSRDGQLVHGYVYLPPGRAADKVPLIANLHGGPFNRDRDHFDEIVQLLVNRGYAVFTPNFRASTGYGQQYLLAPQGEFGKGRVLNDILDGMDFLLGEGVGDRQKQAVMGHSFGGYASLLAVSHEPQRFKFAVASAAPVDFDWVMRAIVDNGGSALPEDGPPGEIFMAHYGLPLSDTKLQQKLKKESPLALLPQLHAPVYLWAGAQDDRVPIKSLTHYAGEAKRHNKTLSLLIDPESGHSPQQKQELEALLYLLESAADTHFGGGLTPASNELQIFLNKTLRMAAGE